MNTPNPKDEPINRLSEYRVKLKKRAISLSELEDMFSLLEVLDYAAFIEIKSKLKYNEYDNIEEFHHDITNYHALEPDRRVNIAAIIGTLSGMVIKAKFKHIKGENEKVPDVGGRRGRPYYAQGKFTLLKGDPAYKNVPSVIITDSKDQWNRPWIEVLIHMNPLMHMNPHEGRERLYNAQLFVYDFAFRHRLTRRELEEAEKFWLKTFDR